MDLDDSADQFLQLVTRAKQGFIEALPGIVTAALVLLLGWLLASLLRKAVRRVFRRVSVEAASVSSDAAWGKPGDEQRTGEVAASGVYWLVLLGAMLVAVDAMGFSILSKWLGAFASYLPRVAIATALVLAGIIAGRLARNATIKAALRVPPSQARSLGRIVQFSIAVAAVLVAAAQLGLDVSLLTSFFLIVLAAVLGGAALAFGLGARELMSDILAMHYIQKSYHVGQVVRVGPDEGRIVRTTRTGIVLQSPEGELTVPGRCFVASTSVLLNREEDHDAPG